MLLTFFLILVLAFILALFSMKDFSVPGEITRIVQGKKLKGKIKSSTTVQREVNLPLRHSFLLDQMGDILFLRYSNFLLIFPNQAN